MSEFVASMYGREEGASDAPQKASGEPEKGVVSKIPDRGSMSLMALTNELRRVEKRLADKERKASQLENRVRRLEQTLTKAINQLNDVSRELDAKIDRREF